MWGFLSQCIIAPWNAYIRWCDKMGSTLENKRSCAPRLEEPSLRSDFSGKSEAQLNRDSANQHTHDSFNLPSIRSTAAHLNERGKK